jgi:hypothetical protein
MDPSRVSFSDRALVLGLGRALAVALTLLSGLSVAAQECWLQQPPPPRSDSHIVAYTANIEGLLQSNLIGSRLHADWPELGLWGAQELANTGSDARRMTADITDGYLSSTVQFNAIGVVVGREPSVPGWQMVSWDFWKLGEDRFPICWSWFDECGRYLIEVLLQHSVTGKRFRFYDTHLSHNSQEHGSQATQRHEEVQKLVEIVTSRVQANELPPIVVGDFNMNWRDTSYNEDANALALMSTRFEMANWKETQCPGVLLPAIDQIWTGRPCSFPQTTGSVKLLRLANVPFDELSDHDGLGANFSILNTPACTPPPPPPPPPPPAPNCGTRTCTSTQQCCDGTYCISKSQSCN